MVTATVINTTYSSCLCQWRSKNPPEDNWVILAYTSGWGFPTVKRLLESAGAILLATSTPHSISARLMASESGRLCSDVQLNNFAISL